jgi:hypothetical protein
MISEAALGRCSNGACTPGRFFAEALASQGDPPRDLILIGVHPVCSALPWRASYLEASSKALQHTTKLLAI